MLIVIAMFTFSMTAGRLLSDVHRLTDIIGGIIFSAGIVTMYSAVCDTLKPRHIC